jgi:hypothetical protein
LRPGGLPTRPHSRPRRRVSRATHLCHAHSSQRRMDSALRRAGRMPGPRLCDRLDRVLDLDAERSQRRPSSHRAWIFACGANADGRMCAVARRHPVVRQQAPIDLPTPEADLVGQRMQAREGLRLLAVADSPTEPPSPDQVERLTGGAYSQAKAGGRGSNASSRGESARPATSAPCAQLGRVGLAIEVLVATRTGSL